MLPPMEVAAKMAKENAMQEHPELSADEIGVCFISPCPAKVSYVKNGFAGHKSYVDEVIAINDIYFPLIAKMRKFFCLFFEKILVSFLRLVKLSISQSLFVNCHTPRKYKVFQKTRLFSQNETAQK